MRSSPDPKRRKTFISCSFIPHNVGTFITSYFCFEKVPKGAHHKKIYVELLFILQSYCTLLLSSSFFLWLQRLLLWFAARDFGLSALNVRVFISQADCVHLSIPQLLSQGGAARDLWSGWQNRECIAALFRLWWNKNGPVFTSWTYKSWLQRVSEGHRLVFVREKLDLVREHSREDRAGGGVSLQASRVVFNMRTLSPWRKQNLNCS